MKRWFGAALRCWYAAAAARTWIVWAASAALTAGKFNEMVGGPHGKLANGWDAVCGAISETTPDARVAARLRWDKGLVNADIQVLPDGAGRRAIARHR